MLITSVRRSTIIYTPCRDAPQDKITEAEPSQQQREQPRGESRDNRPPPSAMEQYEVVEQIGRGAYGTAYLVHHRDENKKRYVMKKIRLSKQNDKFQRTAYQEVIQPSRLLLKHLLLLLKIPPPLSCSGRFSRVWR
jgi:serine/threonine protein kinase